MLVKITELNNIGSNISYTTLIPVVDTAGTATTEKANLQIVGNLILNGAGGSNFPRAAQANIALSVANAAQPNITSVGTLTNLTVSGNVTANLFIGNILGNLTNAVFATNAGNVTNNAQPNITSLGTLVDLEIAGNLNGYSIGNIIEVNLDGNSSNVLHGDGSWSADITDYGNSNVANYLPTYTGNVTANWILADYISGNANPLFYIPSGNLTGVDGNASNVLKGDGTFGTFTGVQGIQGIQGTSVQGITGSQGVQGTTGSQGIQGTTGSQGIQGTTGLQGIQSTQGLQGSLGIQGIQGISGLANLPLANGNSNFDIASANGNVTITTNGTYVYTFDIFGNLSLPGNILSNNTIFIDTRDNSNVADIDLYSGDDILLQGGIRTTTDQPEGGDINIFAGSGGPGSGGESSGGGDISLIAGKGGNAGDTDLGNFGGSINLQAGHGGDADVGNLQVAGGGGSLTIEAGDGGTNGGNTSLGRQGGSLNLYAGNTTEEAQNGAAVTIQSGYGGANALAGNVEINIPASDLGSGGTWYFNGYGNLEAPGNITASSNISGSTLFATFASGNEGGELQLAQPPNGTLSGGITVDAYINQLRFFEQGGTTRGLFIDIANSPAGVSAAIGYRDIPQVAASNTTLAATDAGKHYYSTTAGNLTLTIPNNATTSFQTGTAISIVVQAAGNVLVNAASGVTLYMAGSSSAGNRAVGSYGMATLMKVATDTWFINGTGVY